MDVGRSPGDCIKPLNPPQAPGASRQIEAAGTHSMGANCEIAVASALVMSLDSPRRSPTDSGVGPKTIAD